MAQVEMVWKDYGMTTTTATAATVTATIALAKPMKRFIYFSVFWIKGQQQNSTIIKWYSLSFGLHSALSFCLAVFDSLSLSHSCFFPRHPFDAVKMNQMKFTYVEQTINRWFSFHWNEPFGILSLFVASLLSSELHTHTAFDTKTVGLSAVIRIIVSFGNWMSWLKWMLSLRNIIRIPLTQHKNKINEITIHECCYHVGF